LHDVWLVLHVPVQLVGMEVFDVANVVPGPEVEHVFVIEAGALVPRPPIRRLMLAPAEVTVDSTTRSLPRFANADVHVGEPLAYPTDVLRAAPADAVAKPIRTAPVEVPADVRMLNASCPATNHIR